MPSPWMDQWMHCTLNALKLLLTYKKTLECFTGDTCMLPLGIGFGLGSLLIITLLVFYQRHQMHKQKVKYLLIWSNFSHTTIGFLLILIHWTSGRRSDDSDEGFLVFFQQEYWKCFPSQMWLWYIMCICTLNLKRSNKNSVYVFSYKYMWYVVRQRNPLTYWLIFVWVMISFLLWYGQGEPN